MVYYIQRVRVVGTGWTGAPGLWTFYFQRFSGAGEAMDLEDAQLGVDRVRQAITDAGWLWPGAMKFNVNAQVDMLDAETGELQSQLVADPGAQQSGLSSDTFGPIPTGVLLSLNTGGVVHGRVVRGRSFFAPCVKQADTDGTPRDADRNLAIAFGDALLDNGFEGPNAVVWSRPVTVATPTIPIRDGSAHMITHVSSPNKFAVMRSRRD